MFSPLGGVIFVITNQPLATAYRKALPRNECDKYTKYPLNSRNGMLKAFPCVRASYLFFQKPRLNTAENCAKASARRCGPLTLSARCTLCFRSSRARGAWSMLQPKNRENVERFTRAIAKTCGVSLYRYSNVGNHLHLLVRARSRKAFQSFLREITGTIAALVTGAKKGNAVGKFWDYLAHTRIVTWGRDFRNLELYFIKNLFEAAGLLTRKAKAAGLRVIPLGGWSGPPRPAGWGRSPK